MWIPSSTAGHSHKCWSLVFTTIVSTGILPIFVKSMQHGIHLPLPDCYIEYEMMVNPCTYSQDNFSNGYVIRTFNGSEGIWNEDENYANISVNYPTGFRGILQVALVKHLEFRNQLLQIDLRTSPFRDDLPFTLKVTHLPYKLEELYVRQLGPPGNSYITEDPCHHPDSINDCTILTGNSKLAMKSKKNSIELKLNHPFTHALKVELYGRLCDTSCNDLHPACPTNLTSLQWLNPLVEFTIYDLKSAYYCARVSFWRTRMDSAATYKLLNEVIYNTHNQDCCNIFTKTSSVHYVQWLPHSDHNFHLSSFFYVMMIVLFLIVVVIAFIYLKYCRGMVGHLSMKAHESQRKENTQLISIQEADAQETEVLLLYPKKDKLFMNTMCSFRKLLKVYAKDGIVWDPLDYEQLEKVAENSARWMQRVLMIPDLKIVFVETEEAVAWFDDENRTLDVGGDDLYLYAFSFIHNHPELIFNYQRLFVVRDKTMLVFLETGNVVPKSDYYFQEKHSETEVRSYIWFDYFKAQVFHNLTMVPQKRYNMPHQLGLLIMDIINSHEYSLDHEQSPDDTVEQFYRITEEYQQRHKT